MILGHQPQHRTEEQQWGNNEQKLIKEILAIQETEASHSAHVLKESLRLDDVLNETRVKLTQTCCLLTALGEQVYEKQQEWHCQVS